MRLLSYLLVTLQLRYILGRQVKDHFADFTRAGVIVAGLVASSLIGYQIMVGPQYETAGMIPAQVLRDRKELFGKIVDVIDGDTYRFRHLPSVFSSESFKGSKKRNTITVRIAAVDTPEIAKGADPGQEYSLEAREFASDKLLGKSVRVRCLGRDQYGRLLGRVFYSEPGLFSSLTGGGRKDISEELLRRGLAVVYRGGGAKYDGGLQPWERLEADARDRRVGLWSGGQRVVLPSEYKKRVKTRKASVSRSQ